MNKKGNMMIGIMITVIIAVIALGIAFGTIASQGETTAITDDQFTASAGCVEITDKCILSVTSIENNTDTLGTYQYDLCTVDTAPTRYDGISAHSNFTGYTLNATYTEVECNYIQSGTVRNIVGYAPVLMGLILLVFLAGFIAMKK